MGFMKLSEAAHKMENLFDAIRNGVVEATPDVVDLVLEFIEAIEEMLDNIEETGKEGDVDVDELFEKANAMLKGYTGGGKGTREAGKEKPKEPSKPSTEEVPPPRPRKPFPWGGFLGMFTT